MTKEKFNVTVTHHDLYDMYNPEETLQAIMYVMRYSRRQAKEFYRTLHPSVANQLVYISKLQQRRVRRAV